MRLPDDFPLIEQLPPERGQRRKTSIVLYSCCCCCCCCLHTLGAAVGAVLGGLPGSSPAGDDPDAPIKFVGGLPVAKLAPEHPVRPPFIPSPWLYWSSFLILLVLALLIVPAISVASTGYGSNDVRALAGLQVVFFTLVLAGPLCFLAAGILMAIRVAFVEDSSERTAYWKQLAWITGGIIFGTIAGIAIMWLIFIVMVSR